MCSVIDMDQNFMVTQRGVQRRSGGGRGAGGAYLRQRREERVGLISLLGKPPLYPGFPAAGWEEGCLVSSRATQMRRSRESAALRSYGNKTKSESAKVSDRGGRAGVAVRTTGHLRAKGNLMDTKYS